MSRSESQSSQANSAFTNDLITVIQNNTPNRYLQDNSDPTIKVKNENMMPEHTSILTESLRKASPSIEQEDDE